MGQDKVFNSAPRPTPHKYTRSCHSAQATTSSGAKSGGGFWRMAWLPEIAARLIWQTGSPIRVCSSTIGIYSPTGGTSCSANGKVRPTVDEESSTIVKEASTVDGESPTVEAEGSASFFVTPERGLPSSTAKTPFRGDKKGGGKGETKKANTKTGYQQLG